MKTTLSAITACALLINASAASAARPPPVSACAIIHAVYLAKKAEMEEGAASLYCRKLRPGALDRSGADVDDKNRARLVTSVSRRQSSLGIASNRKIASIRDADGNIVGDDFCDPDVSASLPKEDDIATLAAEADAFLLDAETLCDER